MNFWKTQILNEPVRYDCIQANNQKSSSNQQLSRERRLNVFMTQYTNLNTVTVKEWKV